MTRFSSSTKKFLSLAFFVSSVSSPKAFATSIDDMFSAECEKKEAVQAYFCPKGSVECKVESLQEGPIVPVEMISYSFLEDGQNSKYFKSIFPIVGSCRSTNGFCQPGAIATDPRGGYRYDVSWIDPENGKEELRRLSCQVWLGKFRVTGYEVVYKDPKVQKEYEAFLTENTKVKPEKVGEVLIWDARGDDINKGSITLKNGSHYLRFSAVGYMFTRDSLVNYFNQMKQMEEDEVVAKKNMVDKKKKSEDAVKASFK